MARPGDNQDDDELRRKKLFEAARFTLRSPLSQGTLVADEVALEKQSRWAWSCVKIGRNGGETDW
ncbi:hypothetical protein [Synechococcus sp. PCC 6312]|uniref:hypothetical protein n=1 Tax=Synechococcus sp. (strain ATCC 27167 / PCC 6312) TaxID=195253 RepID=UPI00029EE9D5|nr:hypothetical protein [Synechococcus sp. PCC 6312]AFY62240.1 hypothetical protein Syn6312_3193 [Synechococcus sp. PCC 6312]